MLATSLATHATVDDDLFPLLRVQCCVSEARESRNGPRFSAQDVVTGTVYEVRCRRITEGRPSGAPHPAEQRALLAAQARIDELMNASAAAGSHGVPRSVLLPVDVYIQEQPSTGAAYVVAVEPFAGLSLGDIVRSGWTLIDENTFLDILQCAEEFGKASCYLPPHGNLSADSLKQVLMVRDGATESNNPSRWVVSDWLLTPDPAVFEAERTSDQLVQDLEWLLHSCFSMLSVSSAHDGSTLMVGEVEDAINAMIDRVRHHLVTVCPTQQGKDTPGSTARRLDGGSDKRISARGLLNETADLTLQEKMAYHQNALRSEQVVVQRSRRRRGELPPLAQHVAARPGAADLSSTTPTGSFRGPAGGTGEGDAGIGAYELHYLSSPIVVKPSELLTSPAEQGRAAESPRKPSPNRVEPTREDVLDAVVDLAVRARAVKDAQRRSHGALEKAERELLRATVVTHHAAPAPSQPRAGSAPRSREPSAAAAPAVRRERSSVRRGVTTASAALTSARRAALAAVPEKSTQAAAVAATPARTPGRMPVAEVTPPAVVAAKGGSTRARSVSTTVADGGAATLAPHEQSPEPRRPTPFSKPILKSVQPPPQAPRFGLATMAPRTRPHSAAAGPGHRALPVHLTEERTGIFARVPTTTMTPNARPAGPSRSPASGHRVAAKATAVPAQRVEMRRGPQRLVTPGRTTTANAVATPTAATKAVPAGTEPTASAYPFVKPLPLQQLLLMVPENSAGKSPRSGNGSPRAQTARPRRVPLNGAGTTGVGVAGADHSPRQRQPHTAREPRVRQTTHPGRLSPRSPRAHARDGGTPRSPRQPWDGSPRINRPAPEKEKGATSGHGRAAVTAPRGSGSPRLPGSPRLSGGGGTTPRQRSASQKTTNAAATAEAKPHQGGARITHTRPVATTSRRPRRVSANGSAEHLAKGTVYPVNEASIGIGLRLARMQSGPH